METYKQNTLVSEAVLELELQLSTLVDHVALRMTRPDLDALFAHVETFCVFLGYPRSGHSVIGSVIDAHPDAAIAHRLNAARLIGRGYAMHDVFYLAYENALRFSRGGRKLTGYRYTIPGASQGRVDTLRVIGDQEGKKNAQTLHASPAILDALHALPRVRPRFLHVIRNPYDNITTMAVRACTTLDAATETYFSLCEAVMSTKRRLASKSVLDVHHEAFVARPAETIRALTDFVGLDAADAYVETCAKEAYQSAHRSRSQRAWSTARIDEVRRRSERFEYLGHYTFDGE